MKWEYLTVELEKETMEVESKPDKKGRVTVNTRSAWSAEAFTDQLNKWGAEGFELVSIFHREENQASEGSWLTQRTFATFKRSMGG